MSTALTLAWLLAVVVCLTDVRLRRRSQRQRPTFRIYTARGVIEVSGNVTAVQAQRLAEHLLRFTDDARLHDDIADGGG